MSTYIAPSEEAEQWSTLAVGLVTCSHTGRPMVRGCRDVSGGCAADWPEKLALRCHWSAPRSRSELSLWRTEAELPATPVLSFHVIMCLRRSDVIRGSVDVSAGTATTLMDHVTDVV